MSKIVGKDGEGEFTFRIVQHLGVLGESSSGWKKEVNVVEWNGGKAKLDIRDWAPDHEKMSRGITLHKEETLRLLYILQAAYGEQGHRVEAGGEDYILQEQSNQD